jgi:hypothetical protein
MAVELFENKESGGGKATIIHSDEFMNHSGKAVAKFVKSKKAAENLIVVYDDIDLPLGTMKISFNKSSGGHRGLESIIKALKTKEFTRIRIGISPTTASGKIKKPGSNLSPKAAEKAMDADSSQPPSHTSDSDALNDLEGETTVSDQPRATPTPKIIDVLQDRANNLLNDSHATVESLLQAAALAQQLGLDGLADKALKKAKKLLEQKIDGGAGGSASGLLNAAADAQMLGLDDLANKALEKYANTAEIPCDLVHKNLGNFGINRCQ